MKGHEDCDYWGLTLPQCMRYHGRVARHHGRLSAMYFDKAHRVGRVALVLWCIAGSLVALSLLLQVIA